MASLTMWTELFLQLLGRLAAPCLADYAAGRPLRRHPRAREHRGRHRLSERRLRRRYPRSVLLLSLFQKRSRYALFSLL